MTVQPGQFRIRDISVRPPLVLAPMAGLSHSALRALLAGLGGVGLFFSEMLSARALPVESPSLSPYLIRTPAERPLACQLLVGRVEDVAPAVAALERYGADAVDINFGCPAPRVRRMGGGSALSDSLEAARAITRAVRQATRLPVTAKIRLGECLDQGRLREFCQMLQEAGIDMLTIHARLRGEGYGRPARWEWIGRVRPHVRVPLIANGSIASVQDARRCLEVTGARGLMIGRAAARTPWIFARIAHELYGLDTDPGEVNRPLVYAWFARGLVERFPPQRRLGRLKEFTHYYAANYAFGHVLASAVQSAADMGVALQRAGEFFQRNDAGSWEAAREEFREISAAAG